MKRVIWQALKFFLISGIGWIIDFYFYWILTSRGGEVWYSNFISAVPAVTFVFFLSTKNTFSKNKSRFSLKAKYFIYLLYQFFLLIIMSATGQFLYNMLTEFVVQTVILEHLKIIVKIMITPVTMTINFFVMKLLVEKV